MNFKQMGLYYSMAIFAIILGKLLERAGFNSRRLSAKPTLLKVLSVGFNVLTIGLFVFIIQMIIIMPWMHSKDDFWNFIAAIFPIKRGLYQLKVATFWCMTDVVMKWQRHFSQFQLTLLSVFFTLISCLPSMILTILKPKKWVFTLSLFNISLAFFFFSYHVHEKTILVPLLPMMLNISIFGKYYYDFAMFATFTLYHLLKEDNLVVQYYVILFLFFYFGKNIFKSMHDLKFIRFTKRSLMSIEDIQQSIKLNSLVNFKNLLVKDYIFRLHQILDYLYLRYLRKALYLLAVIFHAADYFVTPPEKYPYLWQLLFSFLGFLVFGLIYIKSHLILFIYLKYSKNIEKIEIQKID
eukprot:TRINITY_DN6866_c0_g1_i3.p1 TRINITY_DN6866_c0_g1~~TRINITY_DN6866_c0_g1_i3.p1  ORF type:complete len:352 (-),score=20.89 TRINITY_DN6866_c0_g1_i3:14-1069(-)